MEILVCVKRVPQVGGKIVVTADGQDVDTRMSGFAMSPHEECAVEEAIQITERFGGGVSVLTLGPPDAAEQLREALALGAGRGVLLDIAALAGVDYLTHDRMVTVADLEAAGRSRPAVPRCGGAGGPPIGRGDPRCRDPRNQRH